MNKLADTIFGPANSRKIRTDASISVDSMDIKSEMKVDSGHDLYLATNVTRTDDLSISFDSIAGLNAIMLQAVENKTKNWIYSTANATITNTAIELEEDSQKEGYPEIEIGDEIEVVYRGDSRFTNGTQKTQISDGTNEVGLTDEALDVNIKSTQITIGGDAEQTPGVAAADKVIQNGGIAETTFPEAVAQGEAVSTWINQYGQQIMYGSNLSSNSIDANIVNQALLNTIDLVLLSAVTDTGASVEIDVSNFNKLTFHIIASGVTSGGTMKIQHSIDGTNYADVAEETVDDNGVTEVVVENRKYKFVRANLTARTDGTFTVLVFGGN